MGSLAVLSTLEASKGGSGGGGERAEGTTALRVRMEDPPLHVFGQTVGLLEVQPRMSAKYWPTAKRFSEAAYLVQAI